MKIKTLKELENLLVLVKKYDLDHISVGKISLSLRPVVLDEDGSLLGRVEESNQPSPVAVGTTPPEEKKETLPNMEFFSSR